MKQVAIIIISLLLGALTYWLVSPLFIDTEVQEQLDPELQARIDAQRAVDAARKNTVTTPEPESASNETNVSAEEPKSEPTVAESFGIQTSGPHIIKSTPGHSATGHVEVISSPEEKLVYYKDYDGTNGPDLKIYLAKDLEATEFVDLGKAKGNQGNLIYGVPLNVDMSEYKYVLTWCEAFGVLFDYAEIN